MIAADPDAQPPLVCAGRHAWWMRVGSHAALMPRCRRHPPHAHAAQPIPGDDANVKAYAYNTIGVDDCPPEDWQVVVDNLEAYVQQYNATGGELNGPRVFTCVRAALL